MCLGWNAVQPYLTLRRVNKEVCCFIIFYYLGGNRTKLYIVCDVKAGKLVYCWVDKCGKVLKGGICKRSVVDSLNYDRWV